MTLLILLLIRPTASLCGTLPAERLGRTELFPSSSPHPHTTFSLDCRFDRLTTKQHYHLTHCYALNTSVSVVYPHQHLTASISNPSKMSSEEEHRSSSVKRIVITEDEDFDLDALLGSCSIGEATSLDDDAPTHTPTPPSAVLVVPSSPAPISSKPSLGLQLSPLISAVEDEKDEIVPANATVDGTSSLWILPAPAKPGDFLTNSIHRVPSKSILKKTSSYGNFDAVSLSPSQSSLKKKSSFLSFNNFMDTSSSSIPSSHGGSSRRVRQTTPSSPIGWDLDSSSQSQINPPSLRSSNVADCVIPSLPNLSGLSDYTETDHADRAAGSLDDTSGNGSSRHSSSSSKMRRNVSFNSVAVREYDRTIGGTLLQERYAISLSFDLYQRSRAHRLLYPSPTDNPSCRSGPPLSLDWSYSKASERNLDAYEEERSTQRAGRINRPQRFHVNKYKRRNMLAFHWGHTEEEMKEARSVTKQMQRQRSITKALMPMHMAEEAVISLKNFLNKKKVKDSVERLRDLHDEERTQEMSGSSRCGQAIPSSFDQSYGSHHTT